MTNASLALQAVLSFWLKAMHAARSPPSVCAVGSPAGWDGGESIVVEVEQRELQQLGEGLDVPDDGRAREAQALEQPQGRQLREVPLELRPVQVELPHANEP